MYTNLPHPMLKKSAWSNCGASCQAIIELAGANFAQVGAAADYDAATAGALYTLLTNAPAIYTVLDVAIYDIHEFMIDLAPGGGRFLVNGYQGGYSGLWWCGASLNGANAAARPLAEAWGKGQDIQQKYQTLAQRLRNLLWCGTWGGHTPGGTTAAAVWNTLPFLPDDTRVTHWVNTDQPIRIKVTRFQVAAPPLGVPMGYATGSVSAALAATEANALNVFAVW